MKNEEEFVSSLIGSFRSSNSRVKLSIGDDCAVFQGDGESQYLITTDGLVEGIHFRIGETYKTVVSKMFVRNISDIFSMGGVPEFAVIHSIIPSEDMNLLMKELKVYSEKTGIALIGGDATVLDEKGRRSLTMTLIGSVPVDRYYTRAGARVGDSLFLSGITGLASLGLMALEKGVEGFAHIKDRYRYFSLPGSDFLQEFRNNPKIHCAIDISDGLLKDLGRIMHASSLGAVIEKERLVLPNKAQELCKVLALDPLQPILGGGDDYEILFTAIPSYKGPGIKIGTIQKTPEVIFSDGTKIRSEGYDHFR